jgi:glycosyltransferase involved in cell wall biosynthesis
MPPTIAYDLTRLLRGLYSSTPNGIDRVDLCYARHYLGAPRPDRTAIILNGWRPWRLGPEAAAAVLARIEAHWQESASTEEDAAFHTARDAILGGTTTARITDLPQRVISQRPGPLRNSGALTKLLLPQLKNLLFPAPPQNGVFFHTTQFPFASMFRWLEPSPGMKAVFFIHDLLPQKSPHFFTTKQKDWHRRALEILARHGSGAIVNGLEVKNDLQDFLTKSNRPDLPILVAPIPADPTFSEPSAPDPHLAARPYFVICGTIEPRKNHLLLLNLWRDLVHQDGPHAPKLVIIGKRGWKNEKTREMLEHDTAILSHVVEISGLSTPAMKHFVAHARALLVPSFAEGYCLPMVEALALGTPVIASDIAVFREIGKQRCVYRNPTDSQGWLDAIRAFSTKPAATQRTVEKNTWPEYFARVDEFIEALSN